MMADIVYTQLATRIPKDLHKAVKLHATKAEMSVMEIVTQALAQYLQNARPVKSVK